MKYIEIFKNEKQHSSFKKYTLHAAYYSGGRQYLICELLAPCRETKQATSERRIPRTAVPVCLFWVVSRYTLEERNDGVTELWSCGKVEVAVLGSRP